MNQPNSPVIANRPAPAAESPDFLSVLRRYTWLLISGAVAGAAVSGGMFFYFYRYEPRYTAHIPFRVSAPPPPIGSGDGATSINMYSDDTSRLINRQMLLFDQEPFLLDIMKDDAFQKDGKHPDDATKKSAWLTRYGSDPKQLKEDLKVVPNVNAAAFEITMSTGDPMESFLLVQAARNVYLQYLKSENASEKDTRRTGLSKALAKEEEQFKIMSDAVQVWASAKQIDVQRSKFDIEKIALTALNSKAIDAQAAADSSEAYYKSLVAQREDVEKNGGEMKLTPEMEQFLENDPEIRTLQQQRINWEQELAVAETNPNNTASKSNKSSIITRIEKIDVQLKDKNAELKKTAARRMEEQAKNRMIGDQTLAQKVGAMRSAKEDLVRSLGQDLMGYEQRVSDLREQQALVNKIRLQNNLADANLANEDVRIQPMVTEPMIPRDISWPKWYVFVPIGTIAGLGLSTLLAYVLTLTDTRVRTPRDISRTLQLPMLGFVPDEGDDRTLTGEVETAILTSPASMIAESFRQIRSHVTAQTAHNPVNTLLVASIAPGGGATTVATNLASAMALNDLRVLLVDANFYRPSMNRIFKNSLLPAEGLTDAVSDPSTLAASIVPHPTLPKLHLLATGSDLAGASAEIFESRVFRELLEQLKSKYDLIIFDGAPLSLVSASLVLASRVDGVISVVRAGEVSRGTVSRVRDQLRGVHANLLGFVLNAAQTSNTGYFKENYRRFYQYANKGRREAAAAR